MQFRIPRKIIFGKEVQNKIIRGVTVAYEAVATTLGSRGRNVMIEKNWGSPVIIHDGVTVAKDVVLRDPNENMVAGQVLEAARRTNDEAGDGTTTATILTYAITKEGIKHITAGINPMVIRKGITEGVKQATAHLKEISKPVKTYKEMEDVATISSADREMGKVIATAIKKVGKHGVVTVQEGQTNDIEVEYKEGMEFNRGMISPVMINSQEKLECVYEGKKTQAPYIAIVNQKIGNPELIEVLRPIYDHDNNAKVLIIADDYDGDAFSTLVINRTKSRKPLVAIKSPEYGDHRTHLLNDLAVVTGATVIGGDGGVPIKNITVEMFGRASKIVSNRDQTIIIGRSGNKKDIEDRIKGLRIELKRARTDGERDKVEARLAKLVGGVAVINVGAASEAEMLEKKERVYDAVNATQAAIDQGIIPGGGVSLLHISGKLKTKDEQLKYGLDIVKQALRYPLRRLISNSGAIDPGFVLEELLRLNDLEKGYDVNSETFVNMYTSGIIDPVKVPLAALKNAASVATMLITTECMMAFDRDYINDSKDQDQGGAQHVL